MRNNELSSIMIMDESKIQMEESERQTRIERHKARLTQDYEEFKKLRAYVIKNMGYLRGKKVPIEVGSIQHLPKHECLILNDLLLVSYTEAMELIMDLKEKDKGAYKNET